jgi:cyanophycinase
MAQQERQEKKGTLIIIGGAEKDGDKEILEVVAKRAGSGKLVVATVATEEPEEMFQEYHQIFRELGVKELAHLDVQKREDALSEDRVRVLEKAKVIFFTGGDQLRITSQLGDSQVYRKVQEIYSRGGTVAGTSAGASVMSETMLVSGNGDQSHRLENAVRMAPGFGLIKDMVIDQHFAERGRLGRLLGAVAQNPRQLGVGIDENTAIVVEGQDSFEVIGEGAVYVLDGSGITYSNLVEDESERNATLSIYGVCLHVLSRENRFDLHERRPVQPDPPGLDAQGKNQSKKK